VTTQAAALRYAVRFPVVLKYTGQLCLVLAALTVVPLSIALLDRENVLSVRYTLVSGCLALVGSQLSRLRSPARVQGNEGMVIVALIFFITPLLMSYPFMAAGLSFVDALFEAISGVTTTGLSTLATVEDKPVSFLFARAWMQWYGGLGIVVLSLAILVEPGLAAKGLAVAETGQDDLVGGARAHARRVLIAYGLLTTGGIFILWLLQVGFFNAVTYTLAAVSTGGFAVHDQSLAGLGGWIVQGAVLFLCFLGALPFALYYRSTQNKRETIHLLQMKMLLLNGVIVTFLVGICLHVTGETSWSETLHHAPLLAFSAQTTAGFSTLSLTELDSSSKLALIFAMAVGGGVGSTAGGFKILRLIIILRLIQFAIVRTGVARHAVVEPSLQSRPLPERELQDALLLIVLFVMVVFVSWLPFLMFGYDPLDALFEVVSAAGTVGLSVGITSTELPLMLKAVLCLDMLLGRLEIIAWLVLISPSTWMGKRAESI